MYSILLYIYQIGVFVMSFFDEKVKKMWRGEQASFSILEEKADPQAEYLWFHAASLGEFEQARPIIEKIKKDTPEEKILLTFFSPSGYEVRKDYEFADIVCYLPIDTPTNAWRFLKRIRVKKAYFIKYEFWMNYMRVLRHQKVPAYSVSSIFRPGQIFFRWYSFQYKYVLHFYKHFFVQNQVSKDLLAEIGLNNVTITGDTRFDRVKQIQEAAMQLPIVEEYIGISESRNLEISEARNLESSKVRKLESSESRKNETPKPRVFIAGSSWQPDEDIFLKYFAEHPDWKLIIAPHVIGADHLKEIEGKLQKYGMTPVYYKDLESNSDNQKPKTKNQKPNPVLIINCFGLLSSIYRYADVTYVGGGFGVGIHSVTEAAVWGKPVFFGPNNARFQEAQDLKACGGGLEITSYDDFAQKMDAFIQQPSLIAEAGKQAGDYVSSKCGATEKVIKLTK